MSADLVGFLLQLQFASGANAQPSSDGTSGSDSSGGSAVAGMGNLPPPPMFGPPPSQDSSSSTSSPPSATTDSDPAQTLANKVAAWLESLANSSSSTSSTSGSSTTSGGDTTATGYDSATTGSTGSTSSQTDPLQAFEQTFAKDLLAALQSYQSGTSPSSTQVTA